MEGIWGWDELGRVRGWHGHQAPLSGGGELGVYAPRCRSVSRGTPSRWEWRSNEIAPAMSSLRSVVSWPSGPSGGVRSTAGSGAGRLGGSRAGGRRGCAPWRPGGRAGPPGRDKAGEGPGGDDHGDQSAHGGQAARRGRHSAPRWRAIVPIPRAASAGWGPVRAAWAVPPLVLGFWLPVAVRGRGEVHLFLRVLLASVLQPSSSTVGFAGGVFSIRVGDPWGVGLLLGLRPGYLPSSGDVVSGQLHTLVIVDGFESHDGELRCAVELRVRDGREPGTGLVAEDASQ